MQRTNDAIKALGFTGLKDIQTEMLKEFQLESDLVLIAPTGSGKTLAFLLPLLESFKEGNITQAMIIAPSRELAIQIEQVFKSMKTGFKVSCCYGGHPIRIEKNNLLDHPTLIVGTPGRLADHLRRGTIETRNIKSLVLDEFDKGLELGFEKEMRAIIDELGYVQHRILVSATEAEEIPDFTLMESPKTLSFIGEKRNQGSLTLYSLQSEGTDKLEELKELIYRVGDQPTIIFCNHRDAVDRIGELLRINKIPSGLFHGALKQEHRERELTKLRNGSTNILITTDLASRGIDIPAIKNVIHYQIPTVQDAFIHRNGRTARMEADGNSFILLKDGDTIPDYVEEITPYVLADHELVDLETQYVTIYLGLGKKDKVNKVDIVGLFYKKGGLEKDELGKIEVLDYCAFIAVNKNKADQLVRNLRDEKIKKKSFKLSLAR